MRFWSENRRSHLGGTVMLSLIWLMNLPDVWHWSTSALIDRVVFFTYLVLVPLGINDYLRDYWELGSDALMRKTSVRRWTVSYAEIVRVAPRNPGRLSAYEHYWTIEYVRGGKTKSIHANPLKIDDFLSALRERAHNATFENWPPPPPHSSFQQLPPPVSLPERLNELARKPIQMPKW